MIIGQTVFAGTYYSPWFPRQGDSAVFGAETFVTTGTLQFQMQTKNSEDVDSSVSGSYCSAASSAMTGTSVVTVTGSSLKELVRFMYTVTGAGNFAHFRVLPPAWRMNGA